MIVTIGLDLQSVCIIGTKDVYTNVSHGPCHPLSTTGSERSLSTYTACFPVTKYLASAIIGTVFWTARPKVTGVQNAQCNFPVYRLSYYADSILISVMNIILQYWRCNPCNLCEKVVPVSQKY